MLKLFKKLNLIYNKMTLQDQLVNMEMTESELDAFKQRTMKIFTRETREKEEKREMARLRKAEHQKKYQQNNKEKLAEYQREYYNRNNGARHKKKMLQAWNRYVDGVAVSNRIVDEMREFYKLTEREIPYRKPVYTD